MPRDSINPVLLQKLKNWFRITLDINNDGIITWNDFVDAVETMVPAADAAKNARLKIVRKRLEQNFQKYFFDLCEVGDANKDGDIDLDEWLDVMNDVVAYIKKNDKFPDWYEGLHKALFRATEFFDDRDVLKNEFVNMMLTYDLDEAALDKAYDSITEAGAKKMDYALFTEFMKKFTIIDEAGHPLSLAL